MRMGDALSRYAWGAVLVIITMLPVTATLLAMSQSQPVATNPATMIAHRSVATAAVSTPSMIAPVSTPAFAIRDPSCLGPLE